jgi:hypothetical protein
LSEAKAVNPVNSVICDYAQLRNRTFVVGRVSVTWYWLIAKLLSEDNGQQRADAITAV